MPFDIARKVTTTLQGEMKWKGNHYRVTIVGKTRLFTPNQLESFYYSSDGTAPESFKYAEFLDVFGLELPSSQASDTSWFEGVETQVVNYLENRIEELN